LLEADAFFVLPQIFYSEKYTFFGHSPGGTWHESDVATVLRTTTLDSVGFSCLHIRSRYIDV
jgi:hypothetical protein